MANETYVGMMEGPQTALSSEQKDKDSERKEEPDEAANTGDEGSTGSNNWQRNLQNVDELNVEQFKN